MSGEAFAIERLREDPALDYARLRSLAAEAGIGMQPIQYGRARKSLGLPPLREAAAPAPPAATPAVTPASASAAATSDDGAATDAPGTPADRSDAPTAKRKGSAAFEFLLDELRKDPSRSYAELRDACAQRGWTVAPIVYGRAKAVLGLVPVKPRGTGKRATATAAAAAAAAANAASVATTPRSFVQVESVAADRFNRQLDDVRNLDQLVAVVKELDAERRRLRDLLDRIVTMIDEALG